MDAMDLACVSNGLVTSTTAGMPFSSRFTPSCILQDVQLPHSAVAVITTSHLDTRSSIISGGAGIR